MPADLTNINNAMVVSINQYQLPLYNWVWRTNPYVSLFSRREFVTQDGLTPQVVTTTGELPTGYPTSLPSIALSNGTGSSCDVAATTVNSGHIVRNYTLQAAAMETPLFCLTDFQFGWEAAQVVSNLQANLGQYITVFWSDLYRYNIIGLINTKVSTLTGGSLSESSNSDYNFSEVAVPTTNLSWDHLNPLYDDMIRNGGELSSVGYSEGQPLFALTVGPGVKRALFRSGRRSVLDSGRDGIGCFFSRLQRVAVLLFNIRHRSRLGLAQKVLLRCIACRFRRTLRFG